MQKATNSGCNPCLKKRFLFRLRTGKNPEERTQKGKQSLRELNIMLKVKCSKCGLTQLISKDLKTPEEITQTLHNDLEGKCICGHIFQLPAEATITVIGEKKSVKIGFSPTSTGTEPKKTAKERWWQK